MFKKMMGLGAAMALVGCGGGGGDSGGNSGGNTNTPSTPQCTATQYLEANVCKNKASQSITDLRISDSLTVGAKTTVSAIASSGLAVSYSSKTPSTCSVSGNQVTAIKAGECSLAANQAGDAKTLAAAEVVIKATVSAAMIASKLPQTGITTCANANRFKLPCTKEALGDLHGLGQDGEVQSGQEMSYTVLTQNGADCVKDNVTGLVWEQKTADDGLRDKDWRYTWYSTDSATNGGAAGVTNGGTCFNKAGGAKCDTAGYVAALNATNYCGYNNWRMPTEEELTNIVDFGGVIPSIDPLFSHTQNNFYWSSSVDAYSNRYAWYMSFGHGVSFSGKKEDSGYVRAVRSDQPPN